MTSSRRFPNLAWAWPQGSRNQLLIAAICPDDTRAFAAIEAWLCTTDLDDATFAEHRLLAAITTRFDEALKRHPEHARLAGLQRLNWTRSVMAINTAKPVLQKMIDAGLHLILLKGACRVALDASEQKSRTAYDLDVLLSRTDFVDAFDILMADGWKNSRGGESALGFRARVSSIRARNFKKGHFGDIDLHQNAYPFAYQSGEFDDTLLKEAMPAKFYDLPVFIPGPEERLAMAFAHGGKDGHRHSDWLVDAASILNSEKVNWNKFLKVVKYRRLNGPAAIALSYLSTEIGLEFPADVLREICGKTRLASPRQMGAMLLSKDSEKLSSVQRVVRRSVEIFRDIKYSGRDKKADSPLFRSFTKPGPSHSDSESALEQQIVPAEKVKEGLYSFSVLVNIKTPSLRRRIEFELNGPTRNLCHFQAVHFRGSGDRTLVKLRGTVKLSVEDFPVVLLALPGKLIQEPPGSPKHEKYGAIPFSVSEIKISHLN